MKIFLIGGARFVESRLRYLLMSDHNVAIIILGGDRTEKPRQLGKEGKIPVIQMIVCIYGC